MGAVVRLTPTLGAVVESVDTPDLKSVGHYACGGSSPPRPTGTLCAYCQLTLLIIMREFNFDSSAISALNIDGDQVNITYNSNGKEYSYRAQDPSGFVAQLEQVIADPEGSVGRFVNQAIRTNKTLVEV